MDRIGLLNNIYAGVRSIYEGRKWLDTEGFEGAGRVSYNNGLSLAIDSFSEAQRQVTSDLEGLISYELAFLNSELQFCDDSDKDSKSSLENAIQTLEDALCALEIVEVPVSYKIVDQAFSHSDVHRYNGMPKDAFHIACEGHKTRIKNILRSPGINITEKKLLYLRRNNIIIAQSVYFEKQKKALLDKE